MSPEVTTIILPRNHGIYTQPQKRKSAAVSYRPASFYAHGGALVPLRKRYRYIRSSVPTALPSLRNTRGTRLFTAQVSS